MSVQSHPEEHRVSIPSHLLICSNHYTSAHFFLEPCYNIMSERGYEYSIKSNCNLLLKGFVFVSIKKDNELPLIRIIAVSSRLQTTLHNFGCISIFWKNCFYWIIVRIRILFHTPMATYETINYCLVELNNGIYLEISEKVKQ